jgi:hypothetical protein
MFEFCSHRIASKAVMTEGDGGLALQAFVLGLQGLDVGFEDMQTRPPRGSARRWA